MTPMFDVAVVGAGPAGSSAACVLARAGARVLLLEKDSFPRPKVCGELLGSGAMQALERLGAREAVERARPESIDRGSILLPKGREIPFRLPAPALGISRFRLDEILARRASESGADVRFGTRVTRVEGDLRKGFQSCLAGASGEEEVRTRAVVGAWGRWDSLDRTLRRRFLKGSRFFGWSRDYRGNTRILEGRVRLYLFPGGYCGLSRIEGQAVNLAGVISDKVRRRLPPGWPAVLDHARRSNGSLEADLSSLDPGPRGFLGTGPVFFTSKPPTEEGILMTGDAAGVIDPFSGEGQAAALHGGILAGETVLQFLSGELSPERCVRTYEEHWRHLFSRQFSWSAIFRRLALRPGLGSLAARLAGRRLVQFAIEATRSK